jgi:hypothetical protein
MKSHRFLLAAVAVIAVLGLFAVPTAEACCTPCQNWCTKTTPPETVCCTGIPVPGDFCGHTTCGEYLCGKRCAVADAEEAVATAMTPLPAATPASCAGEELPFLAPPKVETTAAPTAVAG